MTGVNKPIKIIINLQRTCSYQKMIGKHYRTYSSHYLLIVLVLSTMINASNIYHYTSGNNKRSINVFILKILKNKVKNEKGKQKNQTERGPQSCHEVTYEYNFILH